MYGSSMLGMNGLTLRQTVQKSKAAPSAFTHNSQRNAQHELMHAWNVVFACKDQQQNAKEYRCKTAMSAAC